MASSEPRPPWPGAAAEREKNVPENGVVGIMRLLSPKQRPGRLSGCFNAWNLLPRQAWQRIVARDFNIVSVGGWEAST